MSTADLVVKLSGKLRKIREHIRQIGDRGACITDPVLRSEYRARILPRYQMLQTKFRQVRRQLRDALRDLRSDCHSEHDRPHCIPTVIPGTNCCSTKLTVGDDSDQFSKRVDTVLNTLAGKLFGDPTTAIITEEQHRDIEHRLDSTRQLIYNFQHIYRGDRDRLLTLASRIDQIESLIAARNTPYKTLRPMLDTIVQQLESVMENDHEN